LQKLLDAKSTAARASALMAGRWVQDGLKFLLLLWLARTHQAGFGLFVFGVGVAALIRSVLTLGFDAFTVREFAWDPEARGRILSQMIRLKIFLGLLVLVGILAYGWLQAWSCTEVSVVLIISLGQILEGLADTLFSLYRLAGRQIQEAAVSAASHLFGAAYGAAVLLGGAGVVAMACFLLVANGLRLFLAAAAGLRLQLVPAMSRWGLLIPRDRLRNLLVFIGISFLGSFYNQIQILLMKYFRGFSDLALYGVALGLAGGLADLVATFLVAGVLYPDLASTAANGSGGLGATIRAYFWRLAGFGLGIAFFLCTLGGDLLTLIYGSQYADSVTTLQLLGPATLLSLVNNLLIHALLVEHRETLLLAFHLASAVAAMMLGPFLIPWLGPNGAALNLLACRAIMSTLIFTAAQQYYGVFVWPQVRPFLQGALILGGVFLVSGLVAPSTSQLLKILALLSCGWWLWRWNPGASMHEARAHCQGDD
jgi:O-antigen/teichoic acid export membrane protein